MATSGDTWTSLEDAILRMCYSRVPPKSVSQTQACLRRRAGTLRTREEIAQRIRELRVSSFRAAAKIGKKRCSDDYQLLVEYCLAVTFRGGDTES